MTARLEAIILGCGSSGGVPRLGGADGRGQWGACDPNNPKNRRRRCSLLVRRVTDAGATTVLIDTAPDMREQLLDARVGTLDGVLLTHDHADQLHGIDDLRALFLNTRRRVDVYGDSATLSTATNRFAYCFAQTEGSHYPPILNAHEISPFQSFHIEGAGGAINIVTFSQQHGAIFSLGYRFGGLAYSSDVNGLTDEAFASLEGLDHWIVDALRYTPHPSHAHVAQALKWIERVKPKRAVLTNLHIDLDYARLKSELPANVEPAYDGMQLSWPLD